MIDWIKTQWKKFLIAIGVLGIALATGIDITNLSQNEYLTDIQTIQATECQKGKCKQVLRTVDKGLDYEVHEYKTPKGEIGYQVIFREETDGRLYVKSVGYGAEVTQRTFETDCLLGNWECQ